MQIPVLFLMPSWILPTSIIPDQPHACVVCPPPSGYPVGPQLWSSGSVLPCRLQTLSGLALPHCAPVLRSLNLPPQPRGRAHCGDCNCTPRLRGSTRGFPVACAKWFFMGGGDGRMWECLPPCLFAGLHVCVTQACLPCSTRTGTFSWTRMRQVLRSCWSSFERCVGVCGGARARSACGRFHEVCVCARVRVWAHVRVLVCVLVRVRRRVRVPALVLWVPGHGLHRGEGGCGGRTSTGGLGPTRSVVA